MNVSNYMAELNNQIVHSILGEYTEDDLFSADRRHLHPSAGKKQKFDELLFEATMDAEYREWDSKELLPEKEV